MFRLIATDIDDTLLAPDGSLPRANHDALQRLHEAGVTIVFCSGRADASIQKIAAPILEPADDEYYIAFNGALTVTARSRDVVSRRFLSSVATARIAEYAREHGLYLQGYAGDSFVAESDHEHARKYARETKTSLRVVGDIAAALSEGTPKLLFIGEHEELLRHQSALMELSGDEAAQGFSLMFSKPHYLEVVGPDHAEAATIIATGADGPLGKRGRLEERGVTVLETRLDDGGIDLEALLGRLADEELSSVLVEGGPTLLGSMFDSELVDQVHVFVAPKVAGGREAPSAVAGRGVDEMKSALSLGDVEIEPIGDGDVVISGIVPDARRAHVESIPGEE